MGSVEKLAQLFEVMGEAAERLAALRGTLQSTPRETVRRDVAIGGPVADTATIKNVSQLRGLSGGGSAHAQAQIWREFLREFAEKQRRAEKPAPAEARGKRSVSSKIDDILESIVNYVRKQDAASESVTRFTRALTHAASFLYSFTTGRIITRTGATLPARRFLVRALRRFPRLRPIRSALQWPDRFLRPYLREMRAIRGRPVVRSLAAGGRAAGSLRGARRAAAASAASAARGAATRAAAGAATRAAAAGTLSGSVTAAGALGATAAALGVFVAAVIGAVVAMRLFTNRAKDLATSMLTGQFQRFAGTSQHYSYAQARLRAYEIGQGVRYGKATGPTAILLTEALIQLRKEMGPINRAAIIYGHLFAYSMVQIARLLNAVLTIGKPLLDILEALARSLDKLTPDSKLPIEDFLRHLEDLQKTTGRNPPPNGGFPPWQ